VVLTREIKTAGDPYKLVVKADRSSITADGKDLSFIEVNIVDKKGELVPEAHNLVTFSINGQGSVVGVDSGDPVSMESFKSNRHTALNGKVLCIVQSNGKKGTINVTASADGLQTSTIQIQAK
jgi:beta-galactosidase